VLEVLEDQVNNKVLSQRDLWLQDQINNLLKIMRRRDEFESITTIIENPRNLKHIFRRTYSAWEQLHGEIEFDHLFIANVLRVAAPEVFNFLNDQISHIQWLDRRDINSDEKAIVREKLKNKLSEMINDAPRYDGIEKLVSFLFPYWNSISGTYGVIQGFSDNKTTDYWNRMIREKLDDREISDQQIAKAITKWKQDYQSYTYKNLTLAQAMIEITGFPEKIGQFSELLNIQEILLLISQYLDNVFLKKSIHASEILEIPGMGTCIQLIQGKEIPDAEKWFIKEVSKLFPVNLYIASQVFSNFFQILNKNEYKLVFNTLINNAKSTYSKKEIFIKACKSSSKSIFEFHKLFTHFYKRSTVSEYNPDNWIWLIDLLLDTAKTYGSAQSDFSGQ
jgi:hypothetical protein